MYAVIRNGSAYPKNCTTPRIVFATFLQGSFMQRMQKFSYLWYGMHILELTGSARKIANFK